MSVNSFNASNPPLTTKGDLYGFSTVPTRVPVGTNGQLLTADSTAATGLAWATPAASGGVTLISNTVASANSSLSLSSIPQTYKNLYIVWEGLFTSNSSEFVLRINNNSSSGTYRLGGYSLDNGNLTGGSVTATNATNSPILNNTVSTELHEQSMGFLLIDNYASTSLLKPYQVFYNRIQGIQGYGRGGMGVFNSTSAITSLDIVRTSGAGTFSNATNTSIRLYGVS